MSAKEDQQTNRIAGNNDVGPSKKYFLRNQVTTIKGKIHSKEEMAQTNLTNPISSMELMSHKNARKYYRTENFTVWDENEKKINKEEHDVYDFEIQHNMQPPNKRARISFEIPVTTLGNVCKGSSNSTSSNNFINSTVDDEDDSLDDTTTIVKTRSSKTDSDDEDSDVHMSFISSISRPNTRQAVISCSVFFADIYTYLRFLQTSQCPRVNYLQKQTEITEKMRATLIDWFVDVISEYKLERSTLFSTVSIVDRTLSVFNCKRSRLQLVGATSLLIAAKFEEIYPPEVKEMAYITDNTYTKLEVICMEKVILKSLNYSVSSLTAETFAAMLIDWLDMSDVAIDLVWYILELSLLEYSMLAHRSSDIALSAVLLAQYVVDKKLHGIPPYIQSDFEELRAPVLDLISVVHRAPLSECTSVFAKYSEAKFNNVALIEFPKSVPPEFFEIQN